jgi:hypothetical protein
MTRHRNVRTDAALEDVLRSRVAPEDPFLVDDVLRAIDTTRQVRSRRWLSSALTAPVPLLALLALLLLGAVAVGALLRPPDSDLVVPRPVRADLRFVWIGDGAPIAGLGDGTATATFEMTPDGDVLRFGDRLASDVTEVGDRTLRLVLRGADGPCDAGAIGTYRWSLSPEGDELTLQSLGDECGMRADALGGRWTRSDCPAYPEDFCRGTLLAGEHDSVFFDPFAPADEWRFRRAAMTFTVPGGWSNTGDYPAVYVLQPTDVANRAIYLSSELAAVDEERPCQAVPSREVELNPRALLGWLQERAGLIVSEPAPVSVGGLAGVSVDLAPAADTEETCLGDGPYVPIFTAATEGGLQWGVRLAYRMRVLLLELPADRTLVILVEAPQDDFTSFVSEAAPILDSITFHPPD